MKDTNFLYSIVTLAIGSIIVIFVSYATNTLPTHTPRYSTASIKTNPSKKNCACCSEMTPQEVAAFRQHNEALQKRQQAYKKADELLRQYGLEEGLRRIKQSAPEVAAQLESFTQKYTVDQKH